MILEFSSEDEGRKWVVFINNKQSKCSSKCELKYQSIQEYGDWGSLTCDMVLQIAIGDEPLPTVDSTANNLDSFDLSEARHQPG
jgi:hypothetical protein